MHIMPDVLSFLDFIPKKNPYQKRKRPRGKCDNHGAFGKVKNDPTQINKKFHVK